MTEGDKVKIFPNESFGFVRITVERPLRVRWEVTDDTLAGVDDDRKVANLDAAVGVRLLAAASIDLLQEHRQTLITAAVTGELEVPGVAA